MFFIILETNGEMIIMKLKSNLFLLLIREVRNCISKLELLPGLNKKMKTWDGNL